MTAPDAQAASPPVALAVVSWNTSDLLARCLRSLEPEFASGRAEVWVVDNASADGSAAMVRADFPWVRLIANEENVGFGSAVNQVADRTVSEWIGAANADIALEPGALETMIQTGRENQDAGAVAPRLVLPNGGTQHSVHPFPTVWLAAVFSLRAHRLLPGAGDRLCLEGHWDSERRRYVDWAHGALLLVRRRAWAEVGGFDELQWMYAEDLDIAWRLRHRGWRVIYEPDASVRHEVGAAARQAFGEQRIGRYMESTYSWMARRRGRVVTRVYAGVSLTGAALETLAFWVLAGLRPRRWSRRYELSQLYVRVHRRGLILAPSRANERAPRR